MQNKALLAHGYFYDVWDVGNGRVLKTPRSFFSVAKEMKGKSRIPTVFLWPKALYDFTNEKVVTLLMKRIILKTEPVLFGNPEFKSVFSYTQDKVMLLSEYFETHSIEENKIMFDKYIELQKKFLELGIHDYVYKFKNSYGINGRGELVCIDFNEMTFSRQNILRLVKEGAWKTSAQFRKYPEGELKEYMKESFEYFLTEENVKKHYVVAWNKK